MRDNKEISALLTLIDDPDDEVFGVVSDKIVGYGKSIIPNLEHLWENTVDEELQERIELLIHRLHFTDLKEDFRQWNVSGHHDLMLGSLLVAKFQYPDLATAPVLLEIEKLRRNIWLELNNYLTPLEQVRVVTGILYGYFGLKGSEVVHANINEFFLHKVLESKRGNQVGNAILYLILCDLLDVPVKALGVPKQFVLAYFKPGYSTDPLAGEHLTKIEFFIDPTTGQVFSHKDIEAYFKRLSVPPVNAYFKPLTNKQIMQYLLEELVKCFDSEKQAYKREELRELIQLLD
jgi:regulator of sirC expression with transglutaminase-like and TPR domain